MNICSHQRSLITVSGNSQFNIPAGKVSRNSKTLDNELESCPRMKTVSFYHSLILKHFCKWAKLDVVTNGQKLGGGGGDKFMASFNTAGQCQRLEREIMTLGFQPCRLAFQLGCLLPEHDSTKCPVPPGAKRWRRTPGVEFFMPAPLGIQWKCDPQAPKQTSFENFLTCY